MTNVSCSSIAGAVGVSRHRLTRLFRAAYGLPPHRFVLAQRIRELAREHRVPVVEGTGIKKFYNGPESFTPDNQFILGEAPDLRNFFVGAGFNSAGIASALPRTPRTLWAARRMM